MTGQVEGEHAPARKLVRRRSSESEKFGVKMNVSKEALARRVKTDGRSLVSGEFVFDATHTLRSVGSAAASSFSIVGGDDDESIAPSPGSLRLMTLLSFELFGPEMVRIAHQLAKMRAARLKARRLRRRTPPPQKEPLMDRNVEARDATPSLSRPQQGDDTNEEEEDDYLRPYHEATRYLRCTIQVQGDAPNRWSPLPEHLWFSLLDTVRAVDAERDSDGGFPEGIRRYTTSDDLYEFELVAQSEGDMSFSRAEDQRRHHERQASASSSSTSSSKERRTKNPSDAIESESPRSYTNWWHSLPLNAHTGLFLHQRATGLRRRIVKLPEHPGANPRQSAQGSGNPS
jgi:hypothetical protein